MKKARENNIELLRIIAFLMIIFIHVTPVGLTIPDGIDYHSPAWYYSTIVRILVNPAVSLFMLISGYVAFYNRENYSVKKTIKKLLIPLLMYIPILFSVNFIIYEFSFDIFTQTFKEFLTLTGVFHHLWYIVEFLIIVLLTPFLINGIEEYHKKNKYSWLIIFLFAFLIGVIYLINITFNIKVFNQYIANSFTYFLALYLCGYYINRCNFKIKKSYLVIFIALLYLIYYIMFYHMNFNLSIVDSTLISMILSIFIFMLFKDIEIKRINFTKLSKYTYGAYIVHTFFIFYIQRYFEFLTHVKEKKYFIYDLSFVFLVFISSLFIEMIRQKIIEIFNKSKKEKKTI